MAPCLATCWAPACATFSVAACAALPANLPFTHDAAAIAPAPNAVSFHQEESSFFSSLSSLSFFLFLNFDISPAIPATPAPNAPLPLSFASANFSLIFSVSTIFFFSFSFALISS